MKKKKEKPQELREKILKVLDKELIFSLCGISNKTKEILADQILALLKAEQEYERKN